MNTIWNATKHTTGRGLLYGGGLGALYGTLVVPIIGTIYGLVIGAILGLILGLFIGLAIGCVTYWFFMPLTQQNRYRWTICGLSAGLALIGTVVGLLSLYHNPDWYDWLFVLLPSLIAAAGAGFAGYRYAKTISTGPAQTMVSYSVRDGV